MLRLYIIQINGPQRDEKSGNKEMLYRSKAHRRRRSVTIKTADAEALQIKSPHSEEKSDNRRADAEAIQIKGPQREEKNDNKESGRRGYTDRGPG